MTEEKKIQEVEMKLDGKKYFIVNANSTYRAIVIASSEKEADLLFSNYIDDNPPDDWYTDDAEEITAKEATEEWEGLDIIKDENKNDKAR